MKKDELIYLASPYTDTDFGVRYKRFVEVCKVAGDLIQKGKKVFCPIAMSHSIGDHSEVDAIDHKTWMEQDLTILARCDRLVVLMLEGWSMSVGVREEIEFCEKHNIPVEYLEV